MFSHNIGGIIVPLAASVNQQVQLPAQRGIVVDVVQSSSSLSSGQDRVVGHLGSSVRNTSFQKGGVQLLLGDGSLGALNDGLVRQTGDVVGLLDHGNLKLVLDNSGDLNGLLDGLKVLVSEFEKGDMVGYLVGNGKDARVGALLGEVGEGAVDLSGELDLVDIVAAQGVVDAERKSGPDDIIRIDGRDEES